MVSQHAKNIHLFLLRTRHQAPYWTTAALAAHFDMTVYQMRHHLLQLLKEGWVHRSHIQQGIPVEWSCHLVAPAENKMPLKQKMR